uniref:Neur_chan_LBD domain-containing protein n=1 Tax=Ascaris lumbricoides TaxID=6252 RepID=A0A0M3HNT0_ASCLU
MHLSDDGYNCFFIFFTMCHIFILIISLLVHCTIANEYGEYPRFNTTVISNILNRLTDKSTYDKRLRPKYGAEPVDVGITIHVSSISAVSEVDMVCEHIASLNLFSFNKTSIE